MSLYVIRVSFFLHLTCCMSVHIPLLSGHNRPKKKKKNQRTGSINVYYACEEFHLILSLRKIISAPLCAEDTLLTLIMKWTPVSAVSPLSLPARCLLTAKHVWVRQDQKEGPRCRQHGSEWTLCLSLISALSPSLLLLLLLRRVKPGDQAPATASAEAAERGEEEEAAADQHCCNSGPGGNESKGTGRHAERCMGCVFSRRVHNFSLQHCDCIRKVQGSGFCWREN